MIKAIIGFDNEENINVYMEYDQWTFELRRSIIISLPSAPFIEGYVTIKAETKIYKNVDGWSFLDLVGHWNKEGKLKGIREVNG